MIKVQLLIQEKKLVTMLIQKGSLLMIYPLTQEFIWSIAYQCIQELIHKD